MRENPWAAKFKEHYQYSDISSSKKADKKYIIAFTPRSGSTWLNDVISQTRKLGKPKEWFNTEIPRTNKIIEKYECGSISDYYSVIQAKNKTPNGVFGAEITWFQADLAFQHIGHNSLFDETKIWFWLKRRDFVAQGISLFKAVESGKFHSNDKIKPLEVEYDKEKIRKWIMHILQQEYFFNQYFIEKDIQPIELWYEDIMQNKDECLRNMFGTLDVQFPKDFNFKSDLNYKRLTNQNSNNLIDTFKSHNYEFIDYWKENRKHKKVLDFLKEGI